MNEKEFMSELKKININLTDEQLRQYEEYYKYLIEYNSHTNLTAITEKEEVYLKHFYDSLILTKAYNFNDNITMLDIGCGAGFPGIVIKIAFPNIKLTLLDSNNKKITFCKDLIARLELKDVECINERAEIFIEKRREFYDLVTARAVSNLRVLSELSIPFIKIGGYFVAMKSDYIEELNESKNAIKILGGEINSIINDKLPYNGGKRSFIKIVKINKTDLKYPRNYNQIIKKSL